MINKTYLILALVVLVVLTGAGLYFTRTKNLFPIACTLEAKLCPDGTGVGRTGPKCEFAPCPIAITTSTGTTTVTLQINQPQTVFGTTLTTPVVVEESRCPSDVTCIQAGRVRVALTINSPSGNSHNELEVGKSVTTEDLTITLNEVTPYPLSTRSIEEREYRFIFTVSKRPITPPINTTTTGTLQATITIGPICPVERDGEVCKPTPEMFAARKVYVYRPNHTTPVTTLTPDATGNITTTLPVGDYWVDMPTRGIDRVSGLPATIHISAGSSTVLAIDVDTGIR